MARFQRGTLRQEPRAAGMTWVLRYYATRPEDGKRVEHTLPIGLVCDMPSESQAWAEVTRLNIHARINEPDFSGRVTFSSIAEHYIQHELADQTDAVKPKSQTTITRTLCIIRTRLIPRWGKQIATNIEPLEVEKWLRAVKKDDGLENPTIHKFRQVMMLIYKHAQRYKLIPRGEDANPIKLVRCATTSDYEAMIITPEQAWAVICAVPERLERTLVFLTAATGLRISESLGLRWSDIDFQYNQIHIRRKWSDGVIEKPKTKASRAAVPMHEILAEVIRAWQAETPYGGPDDWVFPSMRLRGKQPRLAGMLIKDHLRPAAVRARVLAQDDRRTFGFHTLRHSLASALVRAKHDPKLAQAMLRHANVTTTLEIYTHVVGEDRLLAQGEFLKGMKQSQISEPVWLEITGELRVERFHQFWRK
jgi:integrase